MSEEKRRTPHDRLAKAILVRGLEGASEVRPEHEVASEPQRVDALIVPAETPQAVAIRKRLGLLGEIASRSCLFEAFHRPPSLNDVRSVVRKQLTLHHLERLHAERSGAAPPEHPPLLWVVSAGRPKSVLARLAFVQVAAWPRGIYGVADGFRLRLVALPDLPKTRSTLLLRLMGKGPTLARAVRDLMALPEDALERQVAFWPIVDTRLTLPGRPEQRSIEEQDFAMDTSPTYEYWKNHFIAEGREAGIEAGRAQGIEAGRAQGIEAGRALGLRTALFRVYEARFGAVPPRVREVIEAMSDPVRLEGWMVVMGTRPLEEIERELIGAEGRGE